jgi:putative transposase
MLELHTSFKVKCCYKVFESELIKNRYKEIFNKVANKYNMVIKEIGFDRDHVHLIVQLNPSMSVSQAAKLLKGTSGRKLLEEFPYMKTKYFWGSGLWRLTVYSNSIDQDSEQISNYVRNQGSLMNTTSQRLVVVYVYLIHLYKI